MKRDPLLRKFRSAIPPRRDIVGVCGFCADVDAEDLPLPFGFDRFVEGDPRNIVTAERGRLVCRDCFRRGRRWRDTVSPAAGWH